MCGLGVLAVPNEALEAVGEYVQLQELLPLPVVSVFEIDLRGGLATMTFICLTIIHMDLKKQRLRVDRGSQLTYANLTSKVLRLKAGPDISRAKEKLALPDLVSASDRLKVVENPMARDCRSQLSISLSA